MWDKAYETLERLAVDPSGAFIPYEWKTSAMFFELYSHGFFQLLDKRKGWCLTEKGKLCIGAAGAIKRKLKVPLW